MSEFTWLEPADAGGGELSDGELRLVLTRRADAVPEKGWVPAYHFELRTDGIEGRAGYLHLRVGLTDDMRMYGGSVGYEVAPEARGRRFAARACRLVLPLARRHGLENLWITCEPDNIASRRTCEILGGELLGIVDLPERLDMYREGIRRVCRYRVTL